MGISGPVIGHVLAFKDYEANTVLTPETLNGISITMWFVPSVFFLPGRLVIRKYIIDNTYYNKIIKNQE